ncbi:FAD-dependent oxidoreductase [Saccharothrix violaceirubra]|uniref:ferredoxin--NADP(+) reductase n=1 Tax=Saccharothrix violaceirubra TaxID=413306 RepID=A0A7W7T9Z1_9PSEU|nr:FAD-dependent oxidoreductase [Saccharothrix violaceirubra]MBB4969264.1 ferredoxin--NADP+ reductase [Saccharothrix violaceirubra]
MTRSLRVAVVGAGPAGIYAADILTKSDVEVSVDLFERMPAPYGLIRYGVAPDHPRIKGIVNALQKILDRDGVRFFGNVEYGVDLKLDDLRHFYDAIVFSTGAEKDRPLDLPGIDLPGSYGAADFVSWYDGHPDVPRTWPLDARQVAVLGVGNVALDVARVLAKTADELLTTEIPDNVHAGLKASPVTDVHVFGRRGPAQAKFTPLELRELDHSPNVEVIVHPEGIDFDAASMAAIRSNKQVEMVVKTLQEWAIRDPGSRPRRLHLHFLEAPVAIEGENKVELLRTERMELTGDGNVRGTGEFTDWPVQAVYRAVGYLSTHLSDLPFDHVSGTVPHQAGRVLDLDEQHIPGVYVTGWIKRGPIGLIGHTKGDALETVTSLLADAEHRATDATPEAVVRFLEQRAIPFTTNEGWLKLDAHEKALGTAQGRDRIKVVDRDEMTGISRS